MKKRLQIRQEESQEHSEEKDLKSSGATIKSICQEAGNISQHIKQLILEEKRKNFMSKTEVSNKVHHLRNFYTMSALHIKKEVLTLPSHLNKLLHSNRKCPHLATNDRLDAIYGACFGFLIGDIVGAHIAFQTGSVMLNIPCALLMNGGGTYNLGPAQGTDQTQIMFSLAEGLIRGQGKYSRSSVAKKYLEWIDSKPFNISAIFLLAFHEIRKIDRTRIKENDLGEMLRANSFRNHIHESNLGLTRILPLVVWGLKLSKSDFANLLKSQLALICPNELVLQTGLVYAHLLRTIILQRDQQLAFYEASKWIYRKGSQKIKELWKFVEFEIEISSHGNMGRLKTGFTYACSEINKKEVNFMEALLKNLLRGGDTDANCSIVMALVGAIVGYNSIPSYFKHKIMNSKMSQSPRPREQRFTSHNCVKLIEELMRLAPQKYQEIESLST